MNLRKLICLLLSLCCLLCLPCAAMGEQGGNMYTDDEEEFVDIPEEPADEPKAPADTPVPAATPQPSAPLATGGTVAADYDGAPWTFPISPADLVMDNLVIASKSSPLSASDAPTDLVNLVARRNNDDGMNANGGVYMATSAALSLRRPAADMLYRMFEEAESQGVLLYAKQGYRSYADEVKRQERAAARGETADVPGESDFQTGMGVVIVGKAWRTKPLNAEGFAASPEAIWLMENAARYGFVLRYPEGKEAETGHPYTPWHFRYVGMGVSRYMQDHHIPLEVFRADAEEALSAFHAAGGDLDALISASKLPEGPVILTETDADGDPEIVLFHD